MLEVKGLCVEECECRVRVSNIDDGSLGWRVVHTRTGFALPVRFLRESDARTAMYAISELVDWSLTIDEILEVVSRETIRKAMTEALAW